MTARNTPTLASIVDEAISERLSGLRVALPGRVESFDRDEGTADVQPLIRDVFVAEDGTTEAETVPVVTRVPVCYPGNGGSFSITWPLEAGDLVLLLVCSSSIDKWLTRGGEVDPEDDRHHNLSDAVALALPPRPYNNPTPDIHETAMVIRAPAEIHAGGSDALATKADIDALKNYIATHVHTGVTTGAGSSGPPASPPPSAAGTSVLKGS